MALVACPTASIGTAREPIPRARRRGRFRSAIEGEVYFCGFARESSYGASSYLHRPAGRQRAGRLAALGRAAC